MRRFGDKARALMSERGIGEDDLFEAMEATGGTFAARKALRLLGDEELFLPEHLGQLVRAITPDEEEQKELLLAFIEFEEAS